VDHPVLLPENFQVVATLIYIKVARKFAVPKPTRMFIPECARVVLRNKEQIDFWTQELSVTETTLRQAIHAAGPILKDIREYLGQSLLADEEQPDMQFISDFQFYARSGKFGAG
jgi:hypothetical protein